MPSLLKRSRQSAPPRSRRRPTAMKEAGPESCAHGLTVNQNECWYDPECADGRGALSFAAHGPTHAPPRLPRRIKRCQLAGSHDDVRTRRRVKPRLCEHVRYHYSTSLDCQHARRPPTHTVSVDVSHPVVDVYGRCSQGPFGATVCASSVERPDSRAADLSYLTIPGPRCRGTRLRRSTGDLGTRTKP